jgi:hypothetical protein
MRRRKLILRSLTVFLALAAPAIGQSDNNRFEGGVFATGAFLSQIGTRDAGVGTDVGGIGGRLVYRRLTYVDLDGDVALLPGNSATTGTKLQGFLGVKAGPRFSKLGVFVKARAGFIYFSRDPFGVATLSSGLFSTDRASSTEPSVDIGAVIEYYTNRGAIVRLDAGDTMIRYASRLVQTSSFLPAVRAGGFTTHNVQISLGVTFRF